MHARLLLIVTIFTTFAAQALDDTQRAGYKAVTGQVLRMDVSGHKNDKVALTGAYLGFAANFYSYMEDSGFKPDRYVAFSVETPSVPIMMRKKDDLLTQLQALRRGVTVTVYGRVKEFRSAPRDARLPKYYIEFDAIEAEMPAIGVANGAGNNGAAIGGAPLAPADVPVAPDRHPLRERFEKRRGDR